MNNIKTNKLIKKYKQDALLFNSQDDTYYLTDFKSTNLTVFYIKGELYAITDDRYFNALVDRLKDSNFTVLNQKNKPYNIISKSLKENKIKNLYIDENNVTLKSFDLIKKLFKGVNILPISYYEFRLIKNNKEVKRMKKACEITDKIFTELLKYTKAGMSEIEIHKFIMRKIYESEASSESFTPIVAAGKNGANPHHKSSDYIIKNKDFVTFDFGVIYDGYCSDLTRTIHIGNQYNKNQKEVYKIVDDARIKGIQAIKPGVKASYIDKIVRDHITKKGYGQYFTHSTGHGLGIAIHEYPNLYPKSDFVIEKGMVFTIEPGIYLKNKFGLRIESDVIVTKDGSKILNNSITNLKDMEV